MSLQCALRAFVLCAVVVLFEDSASAWCQASNVQSSEAPCCQRTGACVESCISAANAPAGTTFLHLSWRSPCLEMNLEQAGARDIATNRVLAVFQNGASQWTSATCSDGRRVGFQLRMTETEGECRTPEYVSGDGNANQIVFVDDWRARGHDRTAYALTTTWFNTRTGEILDADMEVNQQDWRWAECPAVTGCTNGPVDLQNMATHEMGHVFGMAHSVATADATMWGCADPNDVFMRDVSADDVLGLCTIYPPNTLSAACDFEPRGGFDPLCEEDRKGCSCDATLESSSLVSTGFLAFALLALIRRRFRVSK